LLEHLLHLGIVIPRSQNTLTINIMTSSTLFKCFGSLNLLPSIMQNFCFFLFLNRSIFWFINFLDRFLDFLSHSNLFHDFSLKLALTHFRDIVSVFEFDLIDDSFNLHLFNDWFYFGVLFYLSIWISHSVFSRFLNYFLRWRIFLFLDGTIWFDFVVLELFWKNRRIYKSRAVIKLYTFSFKSNCLLLWLFLYKLSRLFKFLLRSSKLIIQVSLLSLRISEYYTV